MRIHYFLGFMVLLGLTSPLWSLPPAPQDVQIDFRVKWDGRIIPDVNFVSALDRKTEVIEYRSGDGPNSERLAPGLTAYQPLILKRPRSADVEFERWANKIVNYGAGLGNEMSLRDYRKDMMIELVDNTGRVLMAFRVYGCWPSEYIPITTLDKNSDDPALEVLILQYEGWERDYSIH